MVAGVPPTIFEVTSEPDFAVTDVGATPGMSVATGAGSDDGNGEGVGVADRTGAGEFAVGDGIGAMAGCVGVGEAEGSDVTADAMSGNATTPASRTTDTRLLSSPNSRLLRHMKVPPENTRAITLRTSLKCNEVHMTRKYEKARQE